MAKLPTPDRWRALTAAVLMLCGAAASAQVADPTRPPDVLNARPASLGAAAPVRVVPGQPQVQSILVSLRPGGRRIAVIDGKMVRPGDRVGNAVVAAIHSTEVILKRGATFQTLKLFRSAPRRTTVQP